jgi:pantetheine-phosphate adenylyltransferase
MSDRIGFYPGSFDPVTNGHLDVIERACRLVDKLIVGVGVSERKTPLLTDEQRLSLLRQTAGPISARSGTPIEFIEFSGLMVQACRQVGANIIVRGLRDTTDYNYEMQMVGMNAQMAPDLQTVFVPASPHVRHISASLVRQIAHMGGDISPFVPAVVLKTLSEGAK